MAAMLCYRLELWQWHSPKQQNRNFSNCACLFLPFVQRGLSLLARLGGQKPSEVVQLSNVRG